MIKSSIKKFDKCPVIPTKQISEHEIQLNEFHAFLFQVVAPCGFQLREQSDEHGILKSLNPLWEGGRLCADTVKSRYLGIEVAAPPYTLGLLMQEYEKDQKPELALGTWKNYVTTYKYINLYLENKEPAKDIRVANVNHSFLSDLKAYIREHPAKNRRPLTQNGLAKHRIGYCLIRNFSH